MSNNSAFVLAGLVLAAACWGVPRWPAQLAAQDADPFNAPQAKPPVKLPLGADPFNPPPKKAPPQPEFRPRKGSPPDAVGPPNADPFGAPPAKPKPPETDPFGGSPIDPDDPFAGSPMPFEREEEKPAKQRPAPRVNAGGPQAGNSASNDDTLRKLAQPIDAEFVELPLLDAVGYIGDILQIQFHLDHRGLDDQAISSDEPVTINLKEVPGEMVLDLVLHNLDLDWYLRHGVVIVSTKEVVELRHTTVVYDVSKICRPSPAPQPGGLASRQASEMFTQLGDAAPSRKVKPAPLSEIDQLAEVVRDSVARDSWDQVGGPGAIRTYRNALIISQTDKVHRQVVDLLNQMEQAVAQ